MTTESLNEAEKWLQEVIDDLSPKEEYNIIAVVVRDRLRECNQEFQRAMLEVIERWLLSYNRGHAVLALMLVDLLQATKFIPALKKLHWRVIFRLSPLLWDDFGYVNDVLSLLGQKERGNN